MALFYFFMQCEKRETKSWMYSTKTVEYKNIIILIVSCSDFGDPNYYIWRVRSYNIKFNKFNELVNLAIISITY